MAFPTNLTIPGGYDSGAGAGIDPVTEQSTGTTGQNDPQTSNYAGYKASYGGGSGNPTVARGYTMSFGADASVLNPGAHVFDPWGPTARPEGGRTYTGPWVNPANYSNSGETYWDSTAGFKYNQMLVTVAENFDPFIQKQEAEDPHWWMNRVPRRAYKLYDGLVHQTNVYRGGLSVYSGLGAWEDLQADPTQKSACAPMEWTTYQYAWETRAWSGKKTAWGSDPFCLDQFKYIPSAMEQLGWIIETGAKFGTAIQNIWNRDMFIYHSVMSARSYVMSKEYRGTSSARYVYEPFCKFDRLSSASTEAGKGAALHAESDYVKKPFIVIDATFGSPEPINFEALQLLRRELSRVCPDGAIGSVGNSKMYAICISADDLDNYIRGNEEERKNYQEADPAALIKGWDIAPTTFRRWLITEDGDQLRFKFKGIIEEYTEPVARHYGYVGFKELAGKKVFIAEAIDPMRAGKPGINGAPIPEANPDYDLAELAIAPVFINHVFTNEFVPSCSGLGHGTYFGVVGGLNGSWKWYNIQTEQNPDQKIGNFRGLFEIVPRPEARAAYATSFVYRRCAQPLESLCPVQNVKINPKGNPATMSTTLLSGTVDDKQADVVLSAPLSFSAGDEVTVTLAKTTWYKDGAKQTTAEGSAIVEAITYSSDNKTITYTVGSKAYTLTATTAFSGTETTDFTTERTLTYTSGTTTETVKLYYSGAADTTYDAMVFAAPTQQQKSIQFTGDTTPVSGLSLEGLTLAKKA